jgi:hypothetical protein
MKECDEKPTGRITAFVDLSGELLPRRTRVPVTITDMHNRAPRDIVFLIA